MVSSQWAGFGGADGDPRNGAVTWSDGSLGCGLIPGRPRISRARAAQDRLYNQGMVRSIFLDLSSNKSVDKASL